MNYIEFFDQIKNLHADQHWTMQDYSRQAPAAVLFFMNDTLQLSLYIDHSILVDGNKLYRDEVDMITEFIRDENKFNWFNFQRDKPSLDDQIATVINAINNEPYTAKFFNEHDIFVRDDNRKLVNSQNKILRELDNRIAYDSLLAFYRNQQAQNEK